VAGVVWIPWYATFAREESFAHAVAQLAPLALRYGATQYSVHRSLDDRHQITQMSWFETKEDWYRFWDGPELAEFRRRHTGHYQIPLTYTWHDELTSGALGPEVALPEPAPEPEPVSPAAA
jgi:hypothetical protein